MIASLGDRYSHLPKVLVHVCGFAFSDESFRIVYDRTGRVIDAATFECLGDLFCFKFPGLFWFPHSFSVSSWLPFLSVSAASLPYVKTGSTRTALSKKQLEAALRPASSW